MKILIYFIEILFNDFKKQLIQKKNRVLFLKRNFLLNKFILNFKFLKLKQKNVNLKLFLNKIFYLLFQMRNFIFRKILSNIFRSSLNFM